MKDHYLEDFVITVQCTYSASIDFMWWLFIGAASMAAHCVFKIIKDKKTSITMQGPKHIPIISHFRDPPHFSLVSTFNKVPDPSRYRAL